jgi:hypothetical protein
MKARCASCEAEIRPGQGRTVDIDQGTGASPTLVIHDDPARCAPVPYVRRTPRPIAH